MERSENRRAKDQNVRLGRWFARAGRSIIPVVIGLVILVAIGYGVYWVIKSVGQATEEYTEVMIDTRDKARRVACQANLHTIWQDLQIYAIDEEGFPPSLEALVRWGANPDLLRCPDPNGPEYVYIAGQDQKMDGRNILVYEREAVHEGGHNVLRLTGQIELLSPQELQMALAETERRLEAQR